LQNSSLQFLFVCPQQAVFFKGHVQCFAIVERQAQAQYKPSAALICPLKFSSCADGFSDSWTKAHLVPHIKQLHIGHDDDGHHTCNKIQN
jgi:hypothetical protein